jgi:uncharacterized protein (DUF1330 family)
MPAYIIFSRLRMRNPKEVELYAQQAPNSFAGYNVKFLARFGRCEVREGGGVEGVAILEFPSFLEATAWYESPAYQSASQHRYKGEDYSTIIVDGVEA